MGKTLKLAVSDHFDKIIKGLDVENANSNDEQRNEYCNLVTIIKDFHSKIQDGLEHKHMGDDQIEKHLTKYLEEYCILIRIKIKSQYKQCICFTDFYINNRSLEFIE